MDKKSNKKNTVFIPNIGMAEVSDYIPTRNEEDQFIALEKQAELDVEIKKQTSNVNFRWSETEIMRAKKIADILGLPYQTYLKSILKQGMDNDEKRLSM